MDTLYRALTWVLLRCYALCGDFALAIGLFTLLSKLVLLPISVWLHKNSIKMVKMQPEINRLKAAHFGDPDAIAEGQAAIFKREKYRPLASVIPLAIQVVLLMGLIGAIRACMGYSFVNMKSFGVDLSLVPNEGRGWLVLSPILAGLSAWAMCAAQNAANVLQSEQSAWNKYGMLILSVGLSLYLGWFVPVGVALYWILSNLLAIVQLYALNAVINPKDYVDYEALEASKAELAELKALGGKKRKLLGDAEARRERADYRRFFSVVNKHLVYYSESSGFYKYFKGGIEYLLENTNLTIHYVTSDPNDRIFELAETHPAIKPYFIGEKKLITLMMKMDADVVIMTMPDLENYHIKRSYVRKDIEYIYQIHGVGSVNSALRKGALDHYDTVFCVGEHLKREIRQMEALDGLPEKKLVETGYPLLDEMTAAYEAAPHPEKTQKQILIAPSWQKDNIIDTCLEKLLDELRQTGHRVIVRPHPQQVRHRDPDGFLLQFHRIRVGPADHRLVGHRLGVLLHDEKAGAVHRHADEGHEPRLAENRGAADEHRGPERGRHGAEARRARPRRRGRRIAARPARALPRGDHRLARTPRLPSRPQRRGRREIHHFRHPEKDPRKKGKQNDMKRSLRFSALALTACAAMLLFGANGEAYIDPSVMTYIIQAVAGIIIAVGAVVGIYWRKARKKVNDTLGIDENRNKEVESDELVVSEAAGEKPEEEAKE